MTERVEPEPSGFNDLHRAVRTMIVARWFAVPWVFLQVLSYEVPYPRGYKTLALEMGGMLVAANLVIWMLHRGPRGMDRARTLAVAGLALDILVMSGFVWLYAFDYDTQIWAILVIAPLEGAIMFQLTGAVTGWAAITILYAARDVWAAERYGNDLLWNSISFRMGVGGIVAIVAGLMARDLLRQRERLSDALAEIKRIDRRRAGLVSMLGHDVRSPLTVIRGVIATLLAKGGSVGDADAHSLLDAADRQARRLERLATDLLDLARLEQGRLELEPERFSVADVVRDALSYIEGGDQISARIEDGLTIHADPHRFEQVVINLASNALNHGAPPITITGTGADGHAVVEISDHGTGVNAAELDNLFEPFNTEKKTGSIGYGLAVVKALIEAQDGTVSYESNEHGGALFRLVLPRG